MSTTKDAIVSIKDIPKTTISTTPSSTGPLDVVANQLPPYQPTKGLEKQCRATAKCNTHRVPGGRGAKLKPKPGPGFTGPATKTPCNILICWHCQVNHNDLNQHLDSCVDTRCTTYVTRRNNGTLDQPIEPPRRRLTATPRRRLAADDNAVRSQDSVKGSGQVVHVVTHTRVDQWRVSGEISRLRLKDFPPPVVCKRSRWINHGFPTDRLAHKALAKMFDTPEQYKALLSVLAVGTVVELTVYGRPAETATNAVTSLESLRVPRVRISKVTPPINTIASQSNAGYSLNSKAPQAVEQGTLTASHPLRGHRGHPNPTLDAYTDEELERALLGRMKRKALDDDGKLEQACKRPRTAEELAHASYYSTPAGPSVDSPGDTYTDLYEPASRDGLGYVPPEQLQLPALRRAHSHEPPDSLDTPASLRGTLRHLDTAPPGSSRAFHAAQVAAFNQRPDPFVFKRNIDRERAIEAQVREYAAVDEATRREAEAMAVAHAAAQATLKEAEKKRAARRD